MLKSWKWWVVSALVFLTAGFLAFQTTGKILSFIFPLLVGGLLSFWMAKSQKKLDKAFFSLLGVLIGAGTAKGALLLLFEFLPVVWAEETVIPIVSSTLYAVLMLLGGAAGSKIDLSQFALGGEGLSGGESPADLKILDTSVIIDGRISDIALTGFMSGVLVVPKFVLNEIQALADSQDSIRRSRARRGLDVLNKLKELHDINLKITSRDYPDVKGVDAKLIRLAKDINGSIMTNDYNLNQVAKLEGILILNLNDLSNALKPVLIPGEEMTLEVIKQGKEHGQGVGYLPDGTMVVVSDGVPYIGKKLRVKVTSVLQTSAGRIIFTEPA